MADTKDKEESHAQQVQSVGLEERLGKIILLLESQNNAWQKCLSLLHDTNSLLFERYKSQDILLEEHPAVKGPPPTTRTTVAPTQPFNNYNDSLPYGTELEEEREAPPQSFPPVQTDIPERPPEYSQREVPPEHAQSRMGPEYTQGESPPGYGDEPHGDYNDDPVSESAAPNSADSATQEPRMRVAPGPPVSSKAELLERVEKAP
jgi:hypothetical protein